MRCACGHQPWHHGKVTYPKYREPCKVCTVCGGTRPNQCLTGCKPCPCQHFQKEAA